MCVCFCNWYERGRESQSADAEAAGGASAGTGGTGVPADTRKSISVVVLPSSDNNTFNIDALSPNATQTILVTGDYNDFDVTQTGLGGTFGHSLYANLTGTLNTVTTQQYGASETVININAVGSNGTFNTKTGH